MRNKNQKKIKKIFSVMQKVFPLDFGLRPEHVFVRFIIVIYNIQP